MRIPVIDKLEIAPCLQEAGAQTLSIGLQSQLNEDSHKAEELNADRLIREEVS